LATGWLSERFVCSMFLFIPSVYFDLFPR